MSSAVAQWREDLDALQFFVMAKGSLCVVHRLAFRRLLGFTPSRDDCLAYFAIHATAFDAAALAKINRESTPFGFRFHLTSRDIGKQVSESQTLS